MHTSWVKLGFFMLLGILVWANGPSKELKFSTGSFTNTCLGQEDETTDLQWFREEMRISPKYMERDQGILGMSWTHFFTMVFLVLFCTAAVVALIMRQKRTKELLNLLAREEEKGGTDS